jgi:uncharacterized membrane protein
MDDKTKSLVAHITLLGWIIALVMNQSDKGANTSFYLRQCLGLYLLLVTGSIVSLIGIGIVGLIIYIIAFILWVLSIVSALSNEQKAVPLVGDFFQKVFKSIS